MVVQLALNGLRMRASCGLTTAAFAEAIAAAERTPTILTQENLKSSNLGETIAATLVAITQSGESPLEGFQIMLRSASSKRAAEIGRVLIEKGHQRVLAADFASQRAALVLSIFAGVQVMRQMIGLSALAGARSADLVKILAPLLQQLVDGQRSHRKASKEVRALASAASPKLRARRR